MSIKVEVPVTHPKALEAVWQVYGIARVKEALEKQKAAYPGFALAMAIVEAEFASARAEMSVETLREVARAGHDVARSLSVSTAFKGRKVYLEVEMPDLADEEP